MGSFEYIYIAENSRRLIAGKESVCCQWLVIAEKSLHAVARRVSNAQWLIVMSLYSLHVNAASGSRTTKHSNIFCSNFE